LRRRRGGGQWPLLLKLAVAGGLAALLAAVVPVPAPARQADEPAVAPSTLSFAALSLAERSSSHVHIYTPYSGVVMEKHVSEGQQVEKGETLYVLFSEPSEKAVTNRQHATSERLRRRLDALRRDMVQAHDAHAVELDAMRRVIHDTRSKLSWTSVQMKGQRNAVEEAVSAMPHRGPHREPLRHGHADNWQRQAQAALAHLREQETRLRIL
jgi:multidrug efflux pump subunit AcrA (membrane-fusion protein)